ncbi:MAG: hypothetical protein K2F56_01655 [Anaeroplasmataceae bacterium]|nr:hypothetical protein [Anaeroplasmataceae bacterium]
MIEIKLLLINRKTLLKEAGYDVEAIQTLVNDIYFGRVSLEEIYLKAEEQKLNR